MLATISEGHADLADVLFLIAFIIFAVWFLLQAAGVAIPPKINVLALGLACISLAFFVV